MEASPASAAPVVGFELPTRPHMHRLQVQRMRTLIPRCSVMLEYGAGGSTYMAAEMGMAHIVSVESDQAFADAVRAKIEQAFPATRLTMFKTDVGPTAMWGRPTDTTGAKNWPAYVLAPWDFLDREGIAPDLVLVDGRFRAACFLASLVRARPGTTILFDDWSNRQELYGFVTRYLPPAEVVSKMGVFTVPELTTDQLRGVACDLAKACLDPA